MVRGDPTGERTSCQGDKLRHLDPLSGSFRSTRERLCGGSFWCGIGSLLINPLLIPSICAIVFGGLGIHRASQTGIGKSPAVLGLVLGVVGAVVGTFLIRNALSMF